MLFTEPRNKASLVSVSDLVKKCQYFSTVRDSLVLIQKRLEKLAWRLKMDIVLPLPVFVDGKGVISKSSGSTGRAGFMGANGDLFWICRSPSKLSQEEFLEQKHFSFRFKDNSGCEITTKPLIFQCCLPTPLEDGPSEPRRENTENIVSSLAHLKKAVNSTTSKQGEKMTSGACIGKANKKKGVMSRLRSRPSRVWRSVQILNDVQRLKFET